MYRTLLSLILIGLLMQGLSFGPVFAAQVNNDAQALEKVRLKVAKLGLGDKARATVRMKDGRKIKGFIAQAGANDFTVRDRKTGEQTLILYGDVSKVEDNRSNNILRNVLIGAGAAGAVLLVLFIAFIHAAQNS